MFTEDLSVFFDDFAVVANFDGVEVDGILDQAYIEAFNSEGYSPVLTCVTADVTAYDEGDQFTCQSKRYMVITKEADGTGVTRMVLREV